MSKAEIEAKKRYGISRGDDIEETSGIDMQRASDFIDGYHQAEKDLELTWEDLATIEKLSNDFIKHNQIPMSDEEFYKEVLKRFQDYKEKKK